MRLVAPVRPEQFANGPSDGSDPAGSHGPVDASREQERLVLMALPVVGALVREMMARVPAHINRDDLVSAGMTALVLSARSYQVDRGIPFSRFAAIRIRGAIIDELRNMDWAVRSVRGRAREAENVTAQLATVLGRSPVDSEIAVALGVSVPELNALRGELGRARVLSLQGFAPETGAELLPDSGVGPESMLLAREQLGYLHDAVAELPERLRHVITAYFFRHRSMSEIAAELGVTDSRISQMRGEALALLKDGMNAQLTPELVPASTSGRRAPARAAYHAAIAARSTVAGRLARTTVTAETVFPPESDLRAS